MEKTEIEKRIGFISGSLRWLIIDTFVVDVKQIELVSYLVHSIDSPTPNKVSLYVRMKSGYEVCIHNLESEKDAWSVRGFILDKTELT